MNTHLFISSRILKRGCCALFVAAALGIAGGASGQEDDGTFVTTMKELSPGVFQIGKIRLDKTKRTVTFPGKLNMAKDLIEYLLVTPDGSTHESLLTSEIQPTDLQFVMCAVQCTISYLISRRSSCQRSVGAHEFKFRRIMTGQYFHRLSGCVLGFFDSCAMSLQRYLSSALRVSWVLT